MIVRSGVETSEGVGAAEATKDDDADSEEASATGMARSIFRFRASSTNLAWPPLFL